ncbi:MarR family transcriptional regulator [Brucella sp. 21LCYQ03]|nr:MarR family transcriptional regulator [Brucella sp. 21LCYQ03]
MAEEKTKVKPAVTTRKRARKAVDSSEAESTLNRDEAAIAYARSGYDLDRHAAFAVRKAHQKATLIFQSIMGMDNLSPPQFAALATILKHGAVSQNHLGRMTSMDPSTISVVVRKLIKDGLIHQSKSKTDQRLSVLTLTNDGLRFTLARLKDSMEVGERLLAPLSDAERHSFLEMLFKIGADSEP